MNEEKLDPRIRDLAGDYNSPPPVPRERLWQNIEARRNRPVPKSRPMARIYQAVWWSMATAAVLAIGIAIGRWNPDVNPSTVVADNTPSAVTVDQAEAMQATATNPDDNRRKVFRYAAVPVFGQAETLLTEYRIAAPATTREEGYTQRARKLLTDTRLLLDSPAAEDPELGTLLSDLELVLAQIVHIAGEPRPEDKEWIAEGIAKNALLPRLRDQMSVPRASNKVSSRI